MAPSLPLFRRLLLMDPLVSRLALMLAHLEAGGSQAPRPCRRQHRTAAAGGSQPQPVEAVITGQLRKVGRVLCRPCCALDFEASETLRPNCQVWYVITLVMLPKTQHVLIRSDCQRSLPAHLTVEIAFERAGRLKLPAE